MFGIDIVHQNLESSSTRRYWRSKYFCSGWQCTSRLLAQSTVCSHTTLEGYNERKDCSSQNCHDLCRAKTQIPHVFAHHNSSASMYSSFKASSRSWSQLSKHLMDSLQRNTKQQGWVVILFFWIQLVVSPLSMCTVLGAQSLTNSCELHEMQGTLELGPVMLN